MLCFYSLPFPITEAILITENQKYIEENISYYIYPEITNANSLCIFKCTLIGTHILKQKGTYNNIFCDLPSSHSDLLWILFFISMDLYLKHHFKWPHDTPLYGLIIFYFNNPILLKLYYFQHSYITDNTVLNVHVFVGMYMCTNIYIYTYPYDKLLELRILWIYSSKNTYLPSGRGVVSLKWFLRFFSL